MTERDYQPFTDMLQAIADLYGKRLTEFSIGIYWNALRHVDLAVVREAMNRHVRNPDNGQFMPKPADLIRMMEGSTQDKALQAWVKVDKALRTVGPHQSVVFDDPLIHRVISEMGGWISLGPRTDEQWPFVAREFEQRYRTFASRGEKPEYPPVLIGQAEAENTRNGLGQEPPVLIGDADGALAVMQAGTSAPSLGLQRLSNKHAGHVALIEGRKVAA